MSKRTAEDTIESAHEGEAPLSKVPKPDDADFEGEEAVPVDVEVIEPPNGKAEPPKIPHTIAEITEGDNIQPEPEDESHEEPHVTEPEDDEAEAEHPDFHEASAPLPDEEAAVPGLPDIPGDAEHEEVVFVDGEEHLIDDNLEGGEEAPEAEEEEGHDAPADVEAPADA